MSAVARDDSVLAVRVQVVDLGPLERVAAVEVDVAAHHEVVGARCVLGLLDLVGVALLGQPVGIN